MKLLLDRLPSSLQGRRDTLAQCLLAMDRVRQVQCALALASGAFLYLAAHYAASAEGEADHWRPFLSDRIKGGSAYCTGRLTAIIQRMAVSRRI